jgi:hypothetical protein
MFRALSTENILLQGYYVFEKYIDTNSLSGPDPVGVRFDFYLTFLLKSCNLQSGLPGVQPGCMIAGSI